MYLRLLILGHVILNREVLLRVICLVFTLLDEIIILSVLIQKVVLHFAFFIVRLVDVFVLLDGDAKRQILNTSHGLRDIEVVPEIIWLLVLLLSVCLVFVLHGILFLLVGCAKLLLEGPLDGLVVVQDYWICGLLSLHGRQADLSHLKYILLKVLHFILKLVLQLALLASVVPHLVYGFSVDDQSLIREIGRFDHLDLLLFLRLGGFASWFLYLIVV